PPVPHRQTPEAAVGEGRREIARIDVAPAIPLARERQHRVRHEHHRAVDPASEVHSQEWEAWIRYRVDEPADEIRAVRSDRVVVAAEPDDASGGVAADVARGPLAAA